MISKLYSFSTGKADGTAAMKSVLGTKGAYLAELARIGVPVPPGFTIPTSYCREFLSSGVLSQSLRRAVRTKIAQLEKLTGREYGSTEKPLLISIRSGAEVSMPGMLETVLNLGVNDMTVEALAESSGNRGFAYDTYRRLIEMYLVTVKGVDYYTIQQTLATFRQSEGLGPEDPFPDRLQYAAAKELKGIYRARFGEDFPQDVWTQLWTTLEAVFSSWNCSRARRYRQIHHIPDDIGTAINVCAMVFGNLGPTSGTGVCFTRDPSTGENILYGEYLPNAQGEDVVAGIRTPLPITAFRDNLPEAYDELARVARRLEAHFGDLQDLEFTVENGHLWILQARNGKRSARATFRIAVDFVREGILKPEEALLRIEPAAFGKLLTPVLDPRAHKPIIARGLAASPGAATGRIVFNSDDAERWSRKGEAVILVREDTSPDDIAGIHSSKGLLTTRGGMTSHAAIVARQMGKCCVAGCSALRIIPHKKILRASNCDLQEGDWITIDGSTGDVIRGRVATQDAVVDDDVRVLLEWARSHASIAILAGIDIGRDAEHALSLGAAGIGLCRTEQSFFDPAASHQLRCGIVARSPEARLKALEPIRAVQAESFCSVLSTCSGIPVTFRLFDHHLSAFCTEDRAELERVNADTGIPIDDIIIRLDALREKNPALGLRGGRIGVVYPEIYDTQTAAVADAVVTAIRKGGNPRARIMVPFVSHVGEAVWLRQRIVRTLAGVAETLGVSQVESRAIAEIPIGFLIETPRAALIAHRLAAHADFLSIALRELTHLASGFHPDDVENFLRPYRTERILTEDDLANTLDWEGVMELVRTAVAGAHRVKPGLPVELTTDQTFPVDSPLLAPDFGLQGLVCSPARLPTLVLHSAQAKLRRNTAEPCPP